MALSATDLKLLVETVRGAFAHHVGQSPDARASADALAGLEAGVPRRATEPGAPLAMHAAVSALHGFSQRGAATAEDATTATASAATRGRRMLFASCMVRPHGGRFFP